MKFSKEKNLRTQRRAARTRYKIVGTASRPRLSVHRTLNHIYAQIIDDTAGKTLVAANDSEAKIKGKKVDLANAVGKLIAQKAKDKKITTVIFDRGSFRYHGRVKALADGARAEGLQF